MHRATKDGDKLSSLIVQSVYDFARETFEQVEEFKELEESPTIFKDICASLQQPEQVDSEALFVMLLPQQHSADGTMDK
ncbi:hypothetical protein AAE478_002013 [Parahypoxylon ruwenzoriense]